MVTLSQADDRFPDDLEAGDQSGYALAGTTWPAMPSPALRWESGARTWTRAGAGAALGRLRPTLAERYAVRWATALGRWPPAG